MTRPIPPAPRRFLLLIAGLAILSAPAPGHADAAAAPAEITRKTLRTAKGLEIAAESGRLAVPEHRGVPGSRTIHVGFLRLRSRAATPHAPLFFLNGGPGSPAVTEDPRALDFWAPFLGVCDVVLIDQRGTRDTSLVWRWDGPPPVNFFVHRDSALRQVDAMNARAREVFRRRGVDLAGYNTIENAADLEALRAALGLERVSLLGFSYGTHLAIAYMRRHPERVESAVLLGAEGPEETLKPPHAMDVALAKLALTVARDPRIGRQVPDLVALYDRAVARLAREPMWISIQVSARGDSARIPVGPFGLDYILRADIGDASDLVVIPRLLWSIERGDPSILAWFVRKRSGVAVGVHGMSEAMDAASGASPARLALIEEQSRTSRFADVVNFPHPHAGVSWGIPDLGEEFRAPLVSSVRTLLVSGELDFNTPPYQAEHLRWGLTDATHLIVENAGHEQTFWQNKTAMPVLVDFLAGKDVRDRRISYPPPRFVPLEGSDPAVFHPSVPR